MTENKRAQIDQLNSIKVKLAPSPIHGVGVFAMYDIPTGMKLNSDMTPQVFTLTFADTKKLKPEIREMLLGQWPNIVNGSHFAYPTTRIQAFINHAFNANYDAKNDVMLMDVKAGMEITENYRAIKSYALVFPWLT